MQEIRTREIVFSTDNNRLSGKAICFNEISNVLYDKENKRFFREVIAPEAITQELIDNSDIKLLVDHEKDKLVARRRNGQGSMAVYREDDGVYFDCECPNTTVGRDIYEMIKRGDYSQMSFAFIDGSNKGDVTWDFSDRSMPIRTVHKVAALFDISIVQNPAYDQTAVSARSIEDLEKTIDEEAKEEPEVKEEPIKDEQEVKETTEPEMEETPTEEVEENREDDYLEALQPYKEIVENL